MRRFRQGQFDDWNEHDILNRAEELFVLWEDDLATSGRVGAANIPRWIDRTEVQNCLV